MVKRKPLVLTQPTLTIQPWEMQLAEGAMIPSMLSQYTLWRYDADNVQSAIKRL